MLRPDWVMEIGMKKKERKSNLQKKKSFVLALTYTEKCLGGVGGGVKNYEKLRLCVLFLKLDSFPPWLVVACRP